LRRIRVVRGKRRGRGRRGPAPFPWGGASSMDCPQDTPARRLLRLVEPAPELPPAQTADSLLAAWADGWREAGVWLLLVPETRLAAWEEALTPRMRRAAAVPAAMGERGRAALRVGLHHGGALLAGGRMGADGWSPALLTRLQPGPGLVAGWAAPAAVLGLAACEDFPAELAAVRPEPFPVRTRPCPMPLTRSAITPQDVHEILGRWILADGYPLVVDLERSSGTVLVDAREGREYLDFFGCFGASPLGWNPPELRDPAWLAKAADAAVNKPSNSDLYSVPMAEFVERMAEVARPEGYEDMFFVDGGALAVENALKIAFDWKVRRNRAKGVDADVGQRVLHFERAFHGRSGYTMSLTNTSPEKTAYFPKFEGWPRVAAPAPEFPLTQERLADLVRDEEEALARVDAAFERYGDDIACIVVEPIQCEGGDRHFRGEFLRGLQARAERWDCLFVLDEVQTGFFTTGRAWCFEHFDDLRPDVFAFGKKSQQCGVMAGPRVRQVPGNVFETSSRINSTWGGNLMDMVRATRILEVIRDEDLAANAAAQGAHWLEGMRELEKRHDVVRNSRGRGLIMAFDLPDGLQRDRMVEALREGGLLGLPCGERSVRFRPHLRVRRDEVDRALEITEAALARL